MRYCSDCGAPVSLQIPPGDNRQRHVCDACGTIHYQNPKVVVGCIPEWEDKILLCRRAIQPRHGLWTLPAGFMERGETTREGAARETLEEANARVEVGPLYSLFNLPHIDQVYLLFRARLLDLGFSPGEESLEVRLFEEDEIPRDLIAFQTVRETLDLYFEDRRHERQGVMYSGDIIRELDGEQPQVRVTIHEDPK
ncbi:NUDIX hydrolase [Thiorhodococcus minor]|uniref:NUDIX hydrolase n=1 Tax=Thiorhodococcus minor TaxID=57489 RepID=A0A6M0K012_9GAMM|nr:NUDIX hydrolase [Thiorhodococcus minor]NEV63138.1 NUDIX hydrolase [Thiorhodococcus minor]